MVQLLDLQHCQMFYKSVFYCSCDTGHHSDGEQEDDISSDEEDQVNFCTVLFNRHIFYFSMNDLA